MGSYIRSVVQIRGAEEWHEVTEPFAQCDLCLGASTPCVERALPCQEGRVHEIRVQSYSLFAILAGFRNYYGWRPIREPRGLPPDLDPPKTDHARATLRRLGPKGRTWLTLAELLDYDWDQSLTAPVSVGWSEYARLLATGWRQYDGFAHGHRRGGAPEAEARRLLASGGVQVIAKVTGRWPRVNCSLTRRARDWAGWFYGFFLPALEGLGAPDEVRLVISFDE